MSKRGARADAAKLLMAVGCTLITAGLSELPNTDELLHSTLPYVTPSAPLPLWSERKNSPCSPDCKKNGVF